MQGTAERRATILCEKMFQFRMQRQQAPHLKLTIFFLLHSPVFPLRHLKIHLVGSHCSVCRWRVAERKIRALDHVLHLASDRAVARPWIVQCRNIYTFWLGDGDKPQTLDGLFLQTTVQVQLNFADFGNQTSRPDVQPNYERRLSPFPSFRVVLISAQVSM